MIWFSHSWFGRHPVKIFRHALMDRDHRRRAIASLAAFALILQSFLSVHALAAVSDHSAEGWRTILICTGDGFRQITLDAENNPVTPPASTDAADECPACVLVCTVTLNPPIFKTAEYQRTETSSFPVSRQNISADALLIRSTRSRAPPYPGLR